MSVKLSLQNKTGILAILVILTLTFWYCAKEKGPAPKISTLANCDTVTNITYNGIIDSIINLKCVNGTCHAPGGTGNGDFTTYAGLKIKVDDGSFRNRVLVTKDMPSTSSGIIMSECDLKRLEIWLNKGAPN